MRVAIVLALAFPRLQISGTRRCTEGRDLLSRELQGRHYTDWPPRADSPIFRRVICGAVSSCAASGMQQRLCLQQITPASPLPHCLLGQQLLPTIETRKAWETGAGARREEAPQPRCLEGPSSEARASARQRARGAFPGRGFSTTANDVTARFKMHREVPSVSSWTTSIPRPASRHSGRRALELALLIVCCIRYSLTTDFS